MGRGDIWLLVLSALFFAGDLALWNSSVTFTSVASAAFLANAAPVIDLDGRFADWLARAGARYALIRPDFYVALTADTAAALQARFATVMDRLHLQSPAALAAE